MRKLKHNGILILPKYIALGYTILVGKKGYQLEDKQEEMAFHWCKKLGTPYVEDEVFRKNFFTDFCKKLGIPFTESINFDQLLFELDRAKWIREHMSKEEKKTGVGERKKLREERRSWYGIATVDGKEVEIANYIAEPSCIFMGRGKHPLRGKWKEGPLSKDIILNLSPDAEVPQGVWKEIVWKPKKMWVASWIDKLSGKTKYVWLSDSWGKKQDREKAKFEKAKELKKNIKDVYQHILRGLESKDFNRMRIATASLLIYTMNIRVGDEKTEDEADTVGCLTLRSEHITFSGNEINFHFLGKDSVEWKKTIVLPSQGRKNLEKLMSSKKNSPLFEGLSSREVTRFLSEKLDGLTAKVFRTYKGTESVRKAMKWPFRGELTKHPELFSQKVKQIHTRFAILEGSKVCNHKKALPKNYDERVIKKEEKVKKFIQHEVEVVEGKRAGNLGKIQERIANAKMDLEFYKGTAEWNLNTTLKSYVDPRVVKSFCDKIDLPYEKIYSKALLKKFSWCLK